MATSRGCSNLPGLPGDVPETPETQKFSTPKPDNFTIGNASY
jgi:hypothetical protein